MAYCATGGSRGTLGWWKAFFEGYVKQWYALLLVSNIAKSNEAAPSTRNEKKGKKRKPQPRAVIISRKSLPPDEADESEASAKRPKRWASVSSLALGDKPREFLQCLAGECSRLDLAGIIKLLASPESQVPIRSGSTLEQLTSQWMSVSGDKHITQFWQAVIEMRISLMCQRYALMEDRGNF